MSPTLSAIRHALVPGMQMGRTQITNRVTHCITEVQHAAAHKDAPR